MTQSYDAVGAEHQGMFAKAGSELVDFGEGIYHGMVETPVNGAVQITNHLTGASLPELHLVDEERLKHSAGGVIGNVVGNAIDFYAVTVATGGIAGMVGGAGMVATGLRLGAVGAAYTTVFQPTDANSEHFFRDRATNGAIGLMTFAGMGASAAFLDAAGAFAVPGARSLLSSIAYGGINGVAGGVAHAEANAVLKQGYFLPDSEALVKDVGTFMAFGMTMGGIQYGLNSWNAPEPKDVHSDQGSIRVWTDKSGNPIRVMGQTPSPDDPKLQIGFTGTQMTNGHWSTQAWTLKDNQAIGNATPPAISGVLENSDGSVTLVNNGVKQEFKNAATVAEQQRQAAEDKIARRLAQDFVEDGKSSRIYDGNKRLLSLGGPKETGGSYVNGVNLSYTEDGAVKSAVFNSNGVSTSFYRNEQGSWDLFMNSQNYKWSGNIKIISGAGNGLEQVELTPASGAAVRYGVDSGAAAIRSFAETTGTYIPGATGHPVVTVDGAGKVTMTGPTASELTPTVNGKPLPSGQTIELKPGDKVLVPVDVGDRYPEYELRPIVWGKLPDGKFTLGRTSLKPNTQFDLELRTS